MSPHEEHETEYIMSEETDTTGEAKVDESAAVEVLSFLKPFLAALSTGAGSAGGIV